MTTSTPTRDLPAVAAYAVSRNMDGEAAAAEWRLATEDERGLFREMADAVITVASLHTAPPAALNPAAPPDALALAETYWAVHQTVAPGLRGGPLPLERLGPKRVEATKAGVLAVVAQALPSVGLLDEALRKACEERDKLREGLKQELADHEAFVDELLENTDDEPHMSDTPEDYAVRYVRHLEAEAERLAVVVREIQIAASHALRPAEDREAGESEDAEPAHQDPPRADPSGRDPYQFPTLAELGGEKFADYPGPGL